MSSAVHQLLHFLALLSCLLVMGCGSFSKLIKPLPTPQANLEIPATWVTRLEADGDAHRWVQRFSDRKLTSVVNLALRENENLAIAAERIRQLQSLELLQKGQQRPNFNASLSSNSGGRFSEGNSTESSSYSLSFSAGWEWDLWGRLRDQTRRAQLNTAAAKADYFAARLSLAANTAKAWFNLVSAQNTLELREQTLENYQNSLRIIERNYKAGVPGVDALDVRFGRNNITSVTRQISQAKLSVVEASQVLELLTSKYPSGELRASPSLPSPLSDLPAVLPLGVLEMRPDLIAARASLQARLKSIDIAQKDLLPSLSLGGSLSDRSVSLGQLLDPAYLSWSIANTLSSALYDGGTRRANIERTLSEHRSAILAYSRDCRTAFQEVEFALRSENSLREQSTLLREEVKVASLAEKQAQRDYSEGLENVRILSVLEAQRRAVSARSSQIAIRNRRLQNQIDLFVAVGGEP